MAPRRHGRVQLTISPPALNPETGAYDVLVTLTNTSAEPLYYPMRLAVTGVAPATVTIDNARGRTADGTPFVNVPLPRTGLAPRASVPGISLRFENPTRASFTFKTAVTAALGGPLPTSHALINKAVAAGQLDSETALVYRVYAEFGAERLPAAYRGADVVHEITSCARSAPHEQLTSNLKGMEGAFGPSVAGPPQPYNPPEDQIFRRGFFLLTHASV